MMKKLWSAIFVLCMILAVMTVSAFAAEDAPQLVDGYYEIYTADQLYWFAAQVNSGNTGINGKLMADIVVNENVLKEDGTLNGDGSNFRTWTPIGYYYTYSDCKSYRGTFDGNNKTVSGLYFNDTSKGYVGLFGYVGSEGVVNNLGVILSYVNGKERLGGVVGYNYGIVSGCYNTGTASGTGDDVGGVVGYSVGGAISNCYNTGNVSGRRSVGGVVGTGYAISNSYNTGTINGWDWVGGVMGYNGGYVSNSYNTGSVIGGNRMAGGVVGNSYDGAINDCYNKGDVSGYEKVGGVVGRTRGGTVSNSYNTGSISGSSDDVGGVVGNTEECSVTECFSTGDISGTGFVGGLVGYNLQGTVSNCYNTGNVSGEEYVGGAVGFDYGTASNCYYLTDCVSNGNTDGKAMTAEQFASGEVAYLLGQDFGQAIGTDTAPILNGKMVYQNQIGGCCADSFVYDYSNTQADAVTTHSWVEATCTAPKTCSSCGETIGEALGHSWVEATCTAPKTCSSCDETIGEALGHSWVDATCDTVKTCSVCGTTEGSALGHSYGNGFCVRCGVYESAVLNGDVYEISNAGQLYWFAAEVNGGNSSINGKLMADIVVNENVLNADGTLNGDGSNFRVWTPIGNYDYQYIGTFDGNGKTVSGLYVNDTTKNYLGLIGYVWTGGVVKNLSVVDSYFYGGNSIGGVVGYNGGTVSGCYNTGTVSGIYNTGGVVGYARGVVDNCYNAGNVSSVYDAGGVVGFNQAGTVSNSNNSGTVSGGDSAGGVAGTNSGGAGLISNCYNTGSVSGNDFIAGVVGYNYEGTVTDCYNDGDISASDYVGGVVGGNYGIVTDCYNDGDISGGWYVGGVVGSNFGTISECHNTGSVSGSNRVGGVAGYNSANGIISDCYNTGIIDGSYITDGVDNCVGGIAGDNNGTVSGCFNTGSVSGCDRIASVNGSSTVGGVVGCSDGTVSNSYNTGDVSGVRLVGGVVGFTYEGTISDCYNIGSVSGGWYVGGVVGNNSSNSTVSNCYYLEGCVSKNNGYGISKTAQQFASGEVAYLLQGDQSEQVWGQLVGAEPYPVLSKDKVYGDNGHYYNDCDHYWDGGSCTEGVNCFICGAVSSYFPGHQWQAATCDQPKTCSACGTTEGKAQGHSYEGVVTEPDCTHAGFTTYTCTGCGDSYYEDFVDPLGHETYSYSFANGVHSLTCSLCGVTENMTSTDGKQFKFNTASPALAVDIVMNIAVTLPAGFESPYMVVEFNGTTTTLNDYTIDQSNGRCVFAFPGINPQVMGDTFVATLYADVDGVQVTVELEYSMLKYINSQLKKSTISDALRTALSDLVMYGEANQVYEGYKTDALLSSLLEDAAKENLTPSTFVNLDAGYNQMAITGTAHSSIDLKGVSMALGSKIMVRMTVYCADPSAYTVKVTINGEDHLYPVSKLPLAAGYTDRYVLEFDQIRATQFGEVITFSFLDADGNQLGRTLTYSVYTYVQKNQGSANANLANLLKAIYNYGESVKII